MSTPNPSMHDQDGASGPNWIKSSLSFANGNCLEMAKLGNGFVGVRDSKHPEGPVLQFTREEIAAFLGGAKGGEFDSFGGA